MSAKISRAREFGWNDVIYVRPEGFPVGPWSSSWSDYHGSLMILDAKGVYVASVQIYQTPRVMGTYDEDRRAINARLIKRLPEFIALLRKAIPYVKDTELVGPMHKLFVETQILL